MTMSQITRNLAVAATLLALAAAANGTLAAEKLVATDASVRTILSFKVPDATAQKLLPEGWQPSPDTAGPSKDANLNVVFVDLLTVQNPDGSPGETVRFASLTVPAKKNGCDGADGWPRVRVEPRLCSGPLRRLRRRQRHRRPTCPHRSHQEVDC